MDKLFENNKVEFVGEISKEAEFNNEVYGEKFYKIFVKSQRISGYEDEIPVMISERMCNINELQTGRRIAVYGQFRSFNQHKENKSRVLLSIFAREMEFLDDIQSDWQENSILLDGFICKKPVYRKTPFGREIADLLVAVNRSYGKSDYIPCIVWGRNARYMSGFEAGSNVQLHGRIQSRTYKKKISETEIEQRTAYEVSVSEIEVVEEG